MRVKIDFTGDSAYLNVHGDAVGKTEAEKIAEANEALTAQGWIGYEIFEHVSTGPTEYHYLAGLK